jgi:ribosomal-protein-alanine N-acetyltransferase
MIRGDLPEVLELENRLQPEYRWTEEDILQTLRRRNAIGMVIDDISHSQASNVVGFMIYELHKTNLTFLHAYFANKGMAKVAGDKMGSKLSIDRRVCIVWNVEQDDFDSQQMAMNAGFRHTSTEDGYYHNRLLYYHNRLLLCDYSNIWEDSILAELNA